jgi:hypothetical protein
MPPWVRSTSGSWTGTNSTGAGSIPSWRISSAAMKPSSSTTAHRRSYRFGTTWSKAEFPAVLREANRRLIIHTVITGGQALADTVMGFKSLAEGCETRSIIVWINEYFGPVEKDGKKFTQLGAFLEHQDKVAGTIVIPRLSPDTFGRDLEDMVARKLTFGEIAWATGFTLMTKQRLRMIERELFEQLDTLNLLEERQSNAN